MSKVIDTKAAIELIHEAVNMKGVDYVDANSQFGWGCTNVIKDKETEEFCPSCIVGHALFLAGIPLEFLYYHAGIAAETIEQWRVSEQGDSIEITKGAVVVFSAAQVIQDDGGTWGEAEKNAEAMRCALESQEIY